MDVPGQDCPAGRQEPQATSVSAASPACCAAVRSGSAGPVLHRRHRRRSALMRRLDRASPAGVPWATVPALRRARAPATQVERIEHRVVGHDRHQLARQQRVRLVGRRRVAEQVQLELVARERPLEGEERAAVERRQAQPRGSPGGARASRSPGCAPSRSPGSGPPGAPSSGRGRPWPRPTRRRSSRPWRPRRRSREYGPTCRLEPGDPVAVDEDVLVVADAGDRASHGEMGGVVDVELVDLADRCGADADRDARRRMSGASRSRCAAESVLESRTPGIRWQPGRMITAAATTAPQVGATPTSSTPTTRTSPSFQRRRSWRRVGTIGAIGA